MNGIIEARRRASMIPFIHRNEGWDWRGSTLLSYCTLLRPSGPRTFRFPVFILPTLSLVPIHFLVFTVVLSPPPSGKIVLVGTIEQLPWGWMPRDGSYYTGLVAV